MSGRGYHLRASTPGAGTHMVVPELLAVEAQAMTYAKFGNEEHGFPPVDRQMEGSSLPIAGLRIPDWTDTADRLRRDAVQIALFGGVFGEQPADYIGSEV